VYPDFYKQLKKIEKTGISIKLSRDRMTVDRNLVSGSGGRYSVFTPFKNAAWKNFLLEKTVDVPSFDGVSYIKKNDFEKVGLVLVDPVYEKIQKEFSKNEFIKIENKIYNLLDIHPDLSVDRGSVFDGWYISESEAMDHFKLYCKTYMLDYKQDRDSLEKDSTSKMSLALAWGLVSSRMLVHTIQKIFKKSFDGSFSEREDEGPKHYITELLWREFYMYLFFQTPDLMHMEYQVKFRETIQWEKGDKAEKHFFAWMQGRTGYPVVDAAMMQLKKTGYMHNRARMIAASILTKNLGVDWRWGQEYFRAMLLDLDESSNNGGWQWGASVGADPKPIRIFNPYLQAENYDKKEIYQNTWLSKDYLENPPDPIVPHALARTQALERYNLSRINQDSVREY
jgi:deoxyribodipyrimidine photolyase